MFLTGYPVEDLALRPSFVEASRAALDRAGRARSPTRGSATWPSSSATSTARRSGVDRLGRPAGSPQNAAAVLHGGEVVARYAKHHLPNYGVFDEYRYFVPGERPCVVRVHGVDVALAICEDLWQDGGPVAGHARGRRRAAAGHQRLAVRAGTRTTSGSRCAGGAPPRPAARSRT